MSTPKKKSGFVPKTFRDAGTEQVFEGGKEHEFEAGAYENYLAAGLIGEKPSASGKPTTDTSGPTA
jgi:hypothetical protein